jgi:hypothetical protein
VSDPSRADVRVTTHDFQRSFQRPTGLADSSVITLDIGIAPPLDGLQSVRCQLNKRDLTVSAVPADMGRWQASVPLHLLETINELRVAVVWSRELKEVVLPEVALLLA